jgi:bla regulator protein blaR1
MNFNLADHLWQSTLFAAAAGSLAWALRKNRAQVRYALWLAASIKFLVPFSLLVWMGSQVGLRTAPAISSQWSAAIEQAGEPFAAPIPRSLPAPRTTFRIADAAEVLWGLGVLAVAIHWWRRSRALRAAIRSARPVDRGLAIPTRSSAALIEPGVFGVFRPVLLLPEGIERRLTRAQLEAVLAHELSHARRRDNIAAAIHMVIEALFWFHPLVWWIGARLVEERERACDEAVLAQGNDPEIYAQGILQVCKLYLETPVACVSGVTGADLRKRIGAIMTNQTQRLGVARKILLAASAIAAIAGPVLVGMLNSPRLLAQGQAGNIRFEAASIKHRESSEGVRGFQVLPSGRLHMQNLPLRAIIGVAYGLPFQGPSRISGGPNWIYSDTFDIEATAEKGAIPEHASVAVREAKAREMLRGLLADRFKLNLRIDMKESPVYTLTVAKGGLKLKKADFQENNCPEDESNGKGCHRLSGGQGRGLHGAAINPADIAQFVSNWSDRPILDKTGITELYKIDTDGWAPLVQFGPPTSDEAKAESDPSRPSLFSILEQVGLKVEARRAPVEIYVVERAEKPSEN